MIYLHILGSGKTKSEMANSKGHLFERLTRALFEYLKMSVTHLDKSENGKEIDIEGITIVGKVKFFAECKAQEDPLDSTDLKKFGFKFLTKHGKDPGVRGYLFTLSSLNQSAQELWDSELEAVYPGNVECYRHDDIVGLLMEHYKLVSVDVIRDQASNKYARSCGDAQLLCVEGDNKDPVIF
jgi:hypothetical protein